MKKVFAAGLSYRTAPVALREKHAVAPADQLRVARHLLETGMVSEVVLLWTCNRVEIYGVGENPRENLARMVSCLAHRRIETSAGTYCFSEGEAIRHLFKVASGLDSMVLGETEITNQVKTAYENARAAGLTGKTLNQLFQKALETAKAIRSTTAIGKGAASVGSVAVQHAQKIFGAHLPQKKIAVVGAGTMAEKCLRHLAKRGAAGITVVNRSLDKAEDLARAHSGNAAPFNDLLHVVADADIVISSTGSPTTILSRGELAPVMAARASRPLVLIDIAVPRDIDPEVRALPGVHLHDIDDLQSTVRESIALREKDLDLCWPIIEAKAEELEARTAWAPREVVVG